MFEINEKLTLICSSPSALHKPTHTTGRPLAQERVSWILDDGARGKSGACWERATMNNPEFTLWWQRHGHNPQRRVTTEEWRSQDGVRVKDQMSAAPHSKPKTRVLSLVLLFCLAMCCHTNTQSNKTPSPIFQSRSSHHYKKYSEVVL